jgi:hypothetical protein
MGISTPSSVPFRQKVLTIMLSVFQTQALVLGTTTQIDSIPCKVRLEQMNHLRSRRTLLEQTSKG